jgi:hypothetical protein
VVAAALAVVWSVEFAGVPDDAAQARRVNSGSAAMAASVAGERLGKCLSLGGSPGTGFDDPRLNPVDLLVIQDAVGGNSDSPPGHRNSPPVKQSIHHEKAVNRFASGSSASRLLVVVGGGKDAVSAFRATGDPLPTPCPWTRTGEESRRVVDAGVASRVTGSQMDCCPAGRRDFSPTCPGVRSVPMGRPLRDYGRRRADSLKSQARVACPGTLVGGDRFTRRRQRR